jgi:CRP/FNR family cyclic AMP-dependent transcriptional regulator
MDHDRLRAIPLFAALDDATLFWVAAFATEFSVPAGKQIIREGDFGYEVMAIQAGEAEVSRGGRRLATLGPGDYFGEIAVLENTLRTATVVATTPMQLVSLSRWHLRRAGGVVDAMRATIEVRKASFS